MSTELIYPRVDFGEAANGPLYPAQKHPVGAAVLAVVCFSVALYLAVTVDEIVIRSTMAAFALLTLALAAALWRYWTIDRFGLVRIRARSQGLRFVAPAWMQPLLVAAGISGVVPGVVWLWLVENGLEGQFFRSGALLGVGLIGLAALTGELIKLPHPSGLTLSEHGVRGVRGARRLKFSWDELAGVEVVYAPRGAKLLFRGAENAKDVLIDSQALASDPRIVAMIVEHYRTHPGDRAELADAEAAVLRIRDSRF